MMIDEARAMGAEAMGGRHANFYRLLFGEDPNADNILALLGLVPSGIERYRDAYVAEHDSYNDTPFDGGPMLCVTARTGGGNREEHDNAVLTGHPWYVFDEDDYWDKTYANYYFRIPAQVEGGAGDGC